MSDKRQSFIAIFGPQGVAAPSAAVGALGARGAALCALAKLHLPVPAGFVLNTEATRALAHGGTDADAIPPLLAQGLAALEQATGLKLGDRARPLLLAIRPSPPMPLPGTGEPILGLGLNDATVEGLAANVDDTAFAHENYRQFMQSYAHLVLGDDPAAFDDLLNLFAEERGLLSPAQIRGSDGPELIQRFKAEIESNGGKSFPQDAHEQLWQAIAALARAWNGPRARMQRKLHGLKDEAGLALVVQAMVMAPGQVQSGWAASHHMQSGEPGLWGDAGTETAARLSPMVNTLAADWHDAVAVEFKETPSGTWLLDARSARRSTAANLKILTNLVAAGALTEQEALLRIDPLALDQLLHATIAPKVPRQVIAQGLAASPGAASGVISFSSDEARLLAGQGHSVILVRTETAPEDIKGLHLAAGVLTTRGGMTSHAAVIARGMGKPCVTGASTLGIDLKMQSLTAPGFVLHAGDTITIDGSTGQVLRGSVALTPPSLSGDFATVLGWADKHRRLKVRANAETVHDAKLAKDFGAEGIGLARAEHMFFEGERINAMREMILADSEKERRAALAQILPMLRADFAELFAIMAGQPVTIRLLDPPLHEFLPREEAEISDLAKALNTDAAAFQKRVLNLREQNPMLGHRGVRLLLSYPEITDMQARAIFEAAAEVTAKTGTAPEVEIMVPLVASAEELIAVRTRISAIAKDVAEASGQGLHYAVGTMIELPRAALKAGDIAKACDFFSFGTNDLTQTTYGISRDDSARFIGEYTSRHIFAAVPFVALDVEGVGELITMAVERGRSTNAKLLLGVCGEHGGEPESIAFFDGAGLDYVSCSPYRVPIARLAAAQAHLKLQTN